MSILSGITEFSKIKRYILYFLLFAFLFAIRIYFISQKEGLHVDEGLSCSISSYNEYGWLRNYETAHAYTGKQLKEITYWDNDSILNAFGDVGRLYKNNNSDSPQTNLYYSALRLWFAGVRTGDLKTIISRGCGLNLLFFSISFVLMTLLGKSLFKKDSLVFLTLFVAFINTGSISNTLFIRPYQLQETCFIAVTLLFAKIVSCSKNKELITSWKYFFIYVFIIGIAFLSGYFAIFYISLLGVTLVFILYNNKQSDAIPFWILVFLSSLIFANILYLGYFNGFFDYRGTQALGKLSVNSFFTNFKLSLKSLISILVNYLFYLPVIILMIVQGFFLFVFKQKFFQLRELSILIFFCALIWCLITIFFAPFKDLRYLMPSFPLLVIGLIFYFNSTALHWRPLFTALYVIIFIFGVLFANGTGKQNNVSFSKIANINHGKKAVYFFNKYPDFPVAVINNQWWKYSCLIPYLNDDQVYYFFDNVSTVRDFFPENTPYYLVIEEECLKQFDYQIPKIMKRLDYVSPFAIFSSY